jgi:putative DNA primase/helicase
MGDNDKHAQQNVGVEKAMAAAQKHQVGVAFPEFTAPGKLSDFNDLHVKEGLPAVKAQVEKALGQTMEASREQAAGVARQQLGEGAEVKQPGPNTRHTGEVLGVNSYHATQATGKKAAVVHQVQDLDKLPVPGQVATIQYRQGRGQVAEKSVDQQKQLQR